MLPEWLHQAQRYQAPCSARRSISVLPCQSPHSPPNSQQAESSATVMSMITLVAHTTPPRKNLRQHRFPRPGRQATHPGRCRACRRPRACASRAPRPRPARACGRRRARAPTSPAAARSAADRGRRRARRPRPPRRRPQRAPAAQALAARPGRSRRPGTCPAPGWPRRRRSRHRTARTRRPHRRRCPRRQPQHPPRLRALRG